MKCQQHFSNAKLLVLLVFVIVYNCCQFVENPNTKRSKNLFAPFFPWLIKVIMFQLGFFEQQSDFGTLIAH